MASLRSEHERWKSTQCFDLRAVNLMLMKAGVGAFGDISTRNLFNVLMTRPAFKSAFDVRHCSNASWIYSPNLNYNLAACFMPSSIRCLKSALGIELKSLFLPPSNITFYDYEVFTPTRFISEKLARDGWRCQAYNKLLLCYFLPSIKLYGILIPSSRNQVSLSFAFAPPRRTYIFVCFYGFIYFNL